MKDVKIAILDMEWTSWKGSASRNWSLSYEKKEIVQIGIVVTKNINEVLKEKKLFFKVKNNNLSNYFQILTKIGINKYYLYARPFKENLFQMENIFKDIDKIFFNGDDSAILVENIKKNKLTIPLFINKMRNIRPFLGKYFKINENKIVSSKLPSMIGLENLNIEHDALGDSKAIYKTLNYLIFKKEIKIEDLIKI